MDLMLYYIWFYGLSLLGLRSWARDKMTRSDENPRLSQSELDKPCCFASMTRGYSEGFTTATLYFYDKLFELFENLLRDNIAQNKFCIIIYGNVSENRSLSVSIFCPKNEGGESRNPAYFNC